MNTRPTSVALISWFLIVTSLFPGIGAVQTMKNPAALEMMRKNLLPVPIQFVWIFAAMIATVISGIFMLQGKSWARSLYLVITGLGLLIGLITSPTRLLILPGAVVYGLFVYLLTRSKSNEYFRTATPAQ